MSRTSIRFLIAFLPLLLPVVALAQGNPMPGFRNPTIFSSSGTGGAFRGWSARVGERCYTYDVNDTTDGYTIKSTCSDPNSPAIIVHITLETTTIPVPMPAVCGTTTASASRLSPATMQVWWATRSTLPPLRSACSVSRRDIHPAFVWVTFLLQDRHRRTTATTRHPVPIGAPRRCSTLSRCSRPTL